MRKVFAISTGSYSNYSVRAIFTTKAKAEEFMKYIPDDYNEIAEWDLDPAEAELIRKGYSPWSVLMLRDGTTESTNRLDIDCYTVTSCSSRIWERTKAEFYKGKKIQDCLQAQVMAKSEAGAVKIANEIRTQMIATGQWPKS